MNAQVKREEKGKCKNAETTVPFLRLKNFTLLFICFVLSILFSANDSKAQQTAATANNFDIHFDIKNMHLWHGSVVTPGAMIASCIEYASPSKKFVAGLWGGASFDGEYTEFSYYTKYIFTQNFNARLISHNNYSNSETPDIFSYNKHTSPNFVDIVLEYTVSESFPLTAYWSTILFGNGGDYTVDEQGTETDSYSTYAELSYNLFPKAKTQLTLFAGGAFSLAATEKTFYSEKANLVNLGMTIKQEITLLSKNLPVSATAFWNPESNMGALQVGISIL